MRPRSERKTKRLGGGPYAMATRAQREDGIGWAHAAATGDSQRRVLAQVSQQFAGGRGQAGGLTQIEARTHVPRRRARRCIIGLPCASPTSPISPTRTVHARQASTFAPFDSTPGSQTLHLPARPRVARIAPSRCRLAPLVRLPLRLCLELSNRRRDQRPAARRSVHALVADKSSTTTTTDTACVSEASAPLQECFARI